MMNGLGYVDTYPGLPEPPMFEIFGSSSWQIPAPAPTPTHIPSPSPSHTSTNTYSGRNKYKS